MFVVQCPRSGVTAFVQCIPGCEQVAGAHLPGCPGADLDAAVRCPPGSGCCQQDHDHAAAANGCAAEHDGVCSLENEDCAVCHPLVIIAPPGSNQMFPAGG